MYNLEDIFSEAAEVLNKGIHEKKPEGFAKELTDLSYAFGNDPSPSKEFVKLLECLLVEYVRDLAFTSQMHADRRGTPLNVNDVFTALKRSPKQHSYAKEALERKRKIEKAKRDFKMNDTPKNKKLS